MLQSCWPTVVAAHAAIVAEPDFKLTTLLAVLPIFGLLLAVLMAPAWQALYGRRVQRFMGLREVATPPAAWWQRRQSAFGRRRAAVADADAAMPLSQAMHQRHARIRRATWAAYLACVAWSPMLAPWMLDMELGDHAAMVLFVAVLAAGPAIVNVVPHGSKPALLIGSVLVLALALRAEDEVELESVLVGFGIVVLLYVTSVHRTMRALVVPLLVLSAAAMFGAVLAVWALLPLNCLPADGQYGVKGWALIAAVLAAATLLFTLCVWLGTRALDALAAVVRRGWLSDRSLVAFTGLAMLSGVLMLAVDDPKASLGLQLALYAGWMGVTAGAYAWMLQRQPCPQVGRRLLMLRVFSKDRKAERLLDAIQSRWQLAGPVLEIAGPDLAKLNLDLNEFIHLVNFKLHDLFQPGEAAPETLAATLDLALDHEGRFRVNEVFCFDTSWRGVVEQMMGLADAVLLDLRGFTDQRRGTAHEVHRLAALGLLPRVVALGDSATDWSYFEHCVAQHGPGPGLALKIEAADRDALAACVDRLVEIADAAGRAPAPVATGDRQALPLASH
ncbi:MAG: hypothetical protein Q8R33_08765 [Burkholderiales bacterium]|nr:hypothetical protein [Burkholderiales bacterium]